MTGAPCSARPQRAEFRRPRVRTSLFLINVGRLRGGGGEVGDAASTSTSCCGPALWGHSRGLAAAVRSSQHQEQMQSRGVGLALATPSQRPTGQPGGSALSERGAGQPLGSPRRARASARADSKQSVAGHPTTTTAGRGALPMSVCVPTALPRQCPGGQRAWWAAKKT